jgi:hypothetical protein
MRARPDTHADPGSERTHLETQQCRYTAACTSKLDTDSDTYPPS